MGVGGVIEGEFVDRGALSLCLCVHTVLLPLTPKLKPAKGALFPLAVTQERPKKGGDIEIVETKHTRFSSTNYMAGGLGL